MKPIPMGHLFGSYQIRVSDSFNRLLINKNKTKYFYDQDNFFDFEKFNRNYQTLTFISLGILFVELTERTLLLSL